MFLYLIIKSFFYNGSFLFVSSPCQVATQDFNFGLLIGDGEQQDMAEPPTMGVASALQDGGYILIRCSQMISCSCHSTVSGPSHAVKLTISLAA